MQQKTFYVFPNEHKNLLCCLYGSHYGYVCLVVCHTNDIYKNLQVKMMHFASLSYFLCSLFRI